MEKFSEEELNSASRVIQKFKHKTDSKVDIFYKLCFCILVPQTKFKTVYKVVEELKQASFYGEIISKQQLLKLISSVRFKNRKSDYLLKAKYEFDAFYYDLNVVLESELDSRAKRKFVIGRIKGLGLKAASHFLRDLGVTDLAIVDTHILKHLGVIDKKFDYFTIEDKIRDQAYNHNISVAEYDAIIWSRMSKTNEDIFIY